MLWNSNLHTRNQCEIPKENRWNEKLEPFHGSQKLLFPHCPQTVTEFLEYFLGIFPTLKNSKNPRISKTAAALYLAKFLLVLKKTLTHNSIAGFTFFFRSIDKKVVDSLWFWGNSLWLFTHTLSFSSLISKFYVWREKVLILAGDSYLENIVSFIHSFIMFCFNGFLGQH